MTDTQTKRKVGAPFGNWNRLVHGRRSPRKRAERLAQRQAEEAEERARFEEWSAPIEARCRAQHARVLAELERERAEREAAASQEAAEFPEFWK